MAAGRAGGGGAIGDRPQAECKVRKGGKKLAMIQIMMDVGTCTLNTGLLVVCRAW